MARAASGGSSEGGGFDGYGGKGGEADGGGIYVYEAILVAYSGSVTQNQAQGGAGGDGHVSGTHGQGIGGGVYLAALLSSHTPVFTVSNNQASTADPEITDRSEVAARRR